MSPSGGGRYSRSRPEENHKQNTSVITTTLVERCGSGVELRTFDYEYPGSNPVLRC